MNKKLISFLAIIAFVFSYTLYQSFKLDKKFAANAPSDTGSLIKELPADFKLKHMDSDQAFDLSTVFNGDKKVLVHFWATWCPPCITEFPELVELTKLVKENQNVVFLFIAVNDKLPEIKKFLKDTKFGENVILLKDDENFHKKLGTYKMPESYLFDSKRKVIKKYSGQQPWTQNYLVEYFKSL